MTRRGLVLLIAFGLLIAAAAAGQAAETASPQLGSPEAAATAYANALGAGDRQAAYELLSEGTRSALSSSDWNQGFDQKRPAMRKPPASSILRAMATTEPTPKVSDVVIHAGEAFILVGGNVQIDCDLVLVRDASGWKVDLKASDEANGRQAGSDFLETLRVETELSRVRQVQEASMPLLRALLAGEAKSFQAAGKAKVEGNRAEVTVTSQIPVNLVLRAVRIGPGWGVDLSRPAVPIDITSPDPMKQAVAMADQAACEEQMQRLIRGIQMYANASGGMLPNPDRWVEQIRPFLTQGTTMHCPNDPQPGISYAMNKELAGKRMNQIANPNLTVLLYESTLRGDNPTDIGSGWPKPPRHADGNLVAFADGSVRAVTMKPAFDVKEGPPSPPPAPGAAATPGRRVGPGGQPLPTRRPAPPGPARRPNR